MPTATELRRDLLAQYRGGESDVDLNDQRFRFTLLRPGLGPRALDGIVESCEWVDGAEDPTADLNAFISLTGTLTLRKPTPEQGDIHVRDGWVVRCDVRWGGQWREAWRMRIWKPGIDSDATWTFELADDSRLIANSADDFRYRRGKRRRIRGWRYDEIVSDVARRYRIPLGRVVRGRHRIRRLEQRSASPLDIISAAVAAERKATGRRYVIRWRDGKLEIVPLRRTGELYTLSAQLTGWQLENSRRGDQATVLTARATAKRGKKTVKLAARIDPHTSRVSRDAVRQFGMIHQQVTFHGIDSQGELVSAAKRGLARRLARLRTATVTHPGIAFLRRGDPVRVSIPEEGYVGSAGLAFCQSVTHRVSAGEYTMDVTLSFHDPQDPVAIQRERDRAVRAAKRAKRAKK